MKFSKLELCEIAKKAINIIKAEREEYWQDYYESHVQWLKENPIKVFWTKTPREIPTFQDYKNEFYKHESLKDEWFGPMSPNEYEVKQEKKLQSFLNHAEKDLDMNFLYLSSTDIENYGLWKLIKK